MSNTVERVKQRTENCVLSYIHSSSFFQKRERFKKKSKEAFILSKRTVNNQVKKNTVKKNTLKNNTTKKNSVKKNPAKNQKSSPKLLKLKEKKKQKKEVNGKQFSIKNLMYEETNTVIDNEYTTTDHFNVVNNLSAQNTLAENLIEECIAELDISASLCANDIELGKERDLYDDLWSSENRVEIEPIEMNKQKSDKLDSNIISLGDELTMLDLELP